VETNPAAAVWKNLYGNTPLMCTTWSGNEKIAKYLISDTAARTSERSESKMTPLLWAALHGNVKMVQFLLENGSSLSELQDDGSTALIWAAKNGHVTLLKWLLSRGCTLSEKTKNGSTPLLCAAKEGEVEMVEYLLECGADLSEINDSQETVLSLAACSEGYLDLVRFLMEFGGYQNEALQAVLEKATDPQIKRCLKYYLSWPILRLIYIGHVDPGCPLSELPRELVVLIAKFFMFFI